MSTERGAAHPLIRLLRGSAGPWSSAELEDGSIVCGDPGFLSMISSGSGPATAAKRELATPGKPNAAEKSPCANEMTRSPDAR